MPAESDVESVPRLRWHDAAPPPLKKHALSLTLAGVSLFMVAAMLRRDGPPEPAAVPALTADVSGGGSTPPPAGLLFHFLGDDAAGAAPGGDDDPATAVSFDLPSAPLFVPTASWTQEASKEGAQGVCIVARAHASTGTHEAQLLAFLFSLFVPNHPDLRVFLAQAGDDDDGAARLAALAARFNLLLQRPDAVVVSRWRGASARAKFPRLTVDDHGYAALDLTLDDVANGRRPDTGGADATVAGGCDVLGLADSRSLYSLHYLPLMMGKLVSEGYDVVGSHWVARTGSDDPALNRRSARAIRERGECGPLRTGRYVEVWADERLHTPGCVDAGAVMMRTQALKASGARLLGTVLAGDASGGGARFAADGSAPGADAAFVGHLTRRQGSRTALIRRVLMVHQ
jgi:hypothetical protein